MTENDLNGPTSEQSRIYGYDVRFTVTRSLMASVEPSEYVLDIEGVIQTDRNGRTPATVGWISGRVVQAGRACNDGESLFDVCDSIDQNLHEYASAVYDYDDEHLKESVSDGCGGADILVVESIQIVSQHRGRRLGLLAMRRTIDTFGTGCALAVIKPFPLQFSAGRDLSSSGQPDWESRMGVTVFTANEQAALAKLREYWAQLGFERVDKTEYFALDLQYKQPTYQELMR